MKQQRHIRRYRNHIRLVNPEVPIKVQKDIINTHFEEIKKELKKEGRVRLNGLGILKIRKLKAKPARMGRNPMTGEQIHLKPKPASKSVKFRVSKELKEALK